MRSGIIIAIVIAVVVIGGLFWFNNQTDQIGLEDQSTKPLAPVVGETGQSSESPSINDTDFAIKDDSAGGMTDDMLPVVGDEITEGVIVVQSATDDAVILDPEETTTTARVVNDAGSADAASMQDVMAVAPEEATIEVAPETGADTAATPSDMGALATETNVTRPAGANTFDPEQVLTPDGFNRDQVIALINDAEELTDDQRATLRALVEGASTNPAMVEATIASIRTALFMPALN